MDPVLEELEASLRRDQEENKYLPDQVVIDGVELSNIRVREISLEPKLEGQEEPENNENEEFNPRLTEDDSEQIVSRDTEDNQASNHDEVMKEIEESLRRDQEENQKLPDRIVLDGIEFNNIRVRDISLEPKIEEDQIQRIEQEEEPLPVIKSRSVSLPTEKEPEKEKEQKSTVQPNKPTLGATLSSTRSPAPTRNAAVKQDAQQQPKQESSTTSKLIVISIACVMVAYIVAKLFK